MQNQEPSLQPETEKTVSSTRTEMAQMMLPNDANVLGKVFGGSLLSMIDLCASVTAQKFSGYVCVTASFDRVDFHEPIEVGEVVTLIGCVVYAGRTSMDVLIEVMAEDARRAVRRHTNTARVTMVALDEGKPVPVPRLVAETREEMLLVLEQRLRRELKAKHREQFRTTGELIASQTDSELKKWMDSDSLLALAKAIEPEL
jgi:acyl-CoA hydrolase